MNCVYRSEAGAGRGGRLLAVLEVGYAPSNGRLGQEAEVERVANCDLANYYFF
jgi:hypothetical protein